MAFEELLRTKAHDLKMIHDTRIKLAHFKKLDERSKSLVPNDIEVRDILNKLAEILHLLGFQRWNKPHYIERDNDSSESTQKVIDKLVATDKDAEMNRKYYIEARSKWFGDYTEAAKGP